MMYHVLFAAVLLRGAYSQYSSYWQAMQHYGEAKNATEETVGQGSTLTVLSAQSSSENHPERNYWQAMQHYGDANYARDESDSQATTLVVTSSQSSAEKPSATEPHAPMTYWQTMQHIAAANNDAAPANQAFLSATQRRATFDTVQLAFAALCSAAFTFVVIRFKRSASKKLLGERLLG
jgi:hypothetical protein